MLFRSGNVLSGRNRGGHALIRDGAKIVEGADDIVEELGLLRVVATIPSSATSGDGSISSGDPLLGLMDPGQPYDLDGLSGLTGVAAVRLLPRLLDLELQGCILRVAGGRFIRPARTC